MGCNKGVKRKKDSEVGECCFGVQAGRHFGRYEWFALEISYSSYRSAYACDCARDNATPYCSKCIPVSPPDEIAIQFEDLRTVSSVRKQVIEFMRRWRNRIDYSAGSGSVSLYGNAQLDTCPSDCEVDEIYAKIQLDTKHIGKGCDRDTYSVRSQRKLCNAGINSINNN
ncbi:calsyntenin-1-like, partial [Tropilaelaps mercedesae]